VNTILCDRSHSAPILDILNDAILTTTALWDYQPRPPKSMDAWFAAKEERSYPVIGVVEGEQLLGFASYGVFRPWPAYKYTVEHAVYVHKAHRRKGVGRRLVLACLEHAQAQSYHTVIAGIGADNLPSIRLHESLGFVACGTIRQAGYKFDRWLDLTFMQYVLPTPVAPTAD
jgi:phosphinothricin acetyltransferase